MTGLASQRIIFLEILIILILSGCAIAQPATQASSATALPGWQDEFDLDSCNLVTTGRNQYFILEPGFQLVLQGGNEQLNITVLDETIHIDGVETRVVEEREWKNGELVEVSRNFFAMCEESKDVFYFGEDVDMFSGGQLSSHSGAWRAGENNARAGLIMPGEPVVGMKYYQEIAPQVAMDRAEVISLDEVFSAPAGEFPNSLVTQEGTALNILEKEFKIYAPGIGLAQDQNLLLVEYGFVEGD